MSSVDATADGTGRGRAPYGRFGRGGSAGSNGQGRGTHYGPQSSGEHTLPDSQRPLHLGRGAPGPFRGGFPSRIGGRPPPRPPGMPMAMPMAMPMPMGMGMGMPLPLPMPMRPLMPPGAAPGIPLRPPQPLHFQPPAPLPASSAPLPAGWSEHVTPQGLRYFFHAPSGSSTYERPSCSSSSSCEGGQSTTEPGKEAPSAPSSSSGTWMEYKDEASGQLYYYNTETKATVWDQPEEFRMQKAREEVERMQAKATAEEQRAEAAAKKKEDEEQHAKTMYEQLPKHERVARFKQFLEDHEVSPQWKWQELMRFITKEGLEQDVRWKHALATSGQKKQTFAEYCTQAINKQTIERRRHVKKVREEYLDLLGMHESTMLAMKDVRWDDLVDSPVFYALRQDARWTALSDMKERRDLFHGFHRDLEKKWRAAKEEKKHKWRKQLMTLLDETLRDGRDELQLRGRRKLDMDLKRRLWQRIDAEGEAFKHMKEDVEKYEVYDWIDAFLEKLRARDAEDRKMERERLKEEEEARVQVFRTSIETLVTAGHLHVRSTWQECQQHLRTATSSELSALVGEKKHADTEPATSKTTALSERRKVRIFKSVMKQLRAKLQQKAKVLHQFLAKGGSGEIPSSMTFEAFKTALTHAIVQSMEDDEPEEGEALPADDDDDKKRLKEGEIASGNGAQDVKAELEQLVAQHKQKDSSESLTFPVYVREVFDMWTRSRKREKAGRSQPERMDGKNGRKRRRERSISTSATRGATPLPRGRSLSRSASRSASRSPSPSRSASHSRSRSGSRSRSRSHSVKRMRQALEVHRGSGSEVEKQPKKKEALEDDDDKMELFQAPQVISEEEEKARAEAIIRQAREKLLAKQKTEGVAVGGREMEDGSDMEEGEEVEEGEVMDE